MTSKIMLLLDELWATIEKNHRSHVKLNASLGLPPPPPLPTRPPPKPFASKPFLHQVSSTPSKKRIRQHQKSVPKTKPKRSSTTVPSATLTSPKPAPKSAPKPTSHSTHQHPKAVPKPIPTPTKHGIHNSQFLPLKDEEPKATEKREWRPPWRPIVTAPNASGRVEWRPPWCNVESS